MPRILLSTCWPQKTVDILSYRLRQRAKEKRSNAYLHLPLLLLPQKQNNVVPQQGNNAKGLGPAQSKLYQGTSYCENNNCYPTLRKLWKQTLKVIKPLWEK